MRTSTVAHLDRPRLKRVLGIFDLFAMGYGDLGSSIYYALGITAFYALGATPLALGLAGIVFICTALTYAEMTSMLHESGGSASFARHAFNDLISFIAGWGLLLDYIVTIAISAFAIGPYLSYFYPTLVSAPIHLSFTVGFILILLIINFFGVRQSASMSLVLAGSTIVIQLAIIVIAAIFVFNFSTIYSHLKINIPNVDWSPTWPEFWKGTAMAMVAYTGIESIAQLGAEAGRPAKTVPRAILLTMAMLILVYFGISFVALSAISPQELSTTYIMDPIAGIVAHLPFGGNILAPLVGVLAAALLFVAANAGLVGASRLSFNMGEYYQLPRFFYRVHLRFRTPHIALIIFAALASLVVLWSRGKMTFLADLYNFGAMLAFFSAHAALIVMRIKKPDAKRPFRVPFNIHFGKYSIPITAIIGCFATCSVWILIVITKPEGRYLGFAWIGLGILMYFIYRRKKQISATAQLSIQKVKIPEFKPLVIKSIVVATRGGTQSETVSMACEIAKLHGAKITMVHVIEVPPSLPLDAQLAHRILLAKVTLKRAEAIAREFGLDVHLELIRARSVSSALLDLLEERKPDLLVIGSMKTSAEANTKGLGSITEKVLRATGCRVWVCASEAHKGKKQETLLPS